MKHQARIAAAALLLAASGGAAEAGVSAHVTTPGVPAAAARQFESRVAGCNLFRRIAINTPSDVAVLVHLGPTGNVEGVGIGAHPSSPSQMVQLGLPGMDAIRDCGPYALPRPRTPRGRI